MVCPASLELTRLGNIMISKFTHTKTPNFGMRKLPTYDLSTPVGRYAKRVFDLPRVPELDEENVVKELHSGSQNARKSLFDTALRFVIFNVDNLAGLNHPDAMDLIQAGNLALAVTMDNAAKNKKGPATLLGALNTRVRQVVMDALSKDVKLELPEYVWKRDDISFAEVKASKGTLRRVRSTKLGEHLPLSMRVGRNKTLADVIAFDEAETPLSAVLKRDEARCANEILSELDSRQAYIVSSRLNDPELTFAELGSGYKVTAARARQLENKGYSRLRQIVQRRPLGKYAEAD